MGTILKRITFIVGITFCFFFGEVYSQVTMHGGKGLHRVLSAEPVLPTDIFVKGTFSMFAEKTGPETLSKYYNANLNATVGLAKYLECFLNIVPYQDDQYHIWGGAGDTRLGLKYLTPITTDAFKLGFMTFYKFPTAEVSNVTYELFSTSKPAWGAEALLTFDFFDVLPSSPMKINFNIGYMDHNIRDRFFQAKYDQLLIGSGLKFSIQSSQLYLEYSGEIFFNNPGVVDFSQNSMRLTPGFRFLGPWQKTIDLAFDFSLTSYDSLKNTDRSFHKEYFGWKFTIGVTHRFSVFKYFDQTAKLERKKQLEELRKLEEIRKKREKANQDLKKMKDLLDKKKSKGK
jgi:hypothetical protein